MAAKNAVLGIENGTFYYGNNLVFENVSFMLDDARTGLVGENGAGKSTMLKCLTGELQLNSGNIIKSRGMRIAYLQQDVPHEYLEMTVREVLSLALERSGHEDEEWKIDVLLADMNIEYEDAEKKFGAFSGGWQRLALIAAATNLEAPDILILDEPTNHLDFKHLARLEDWLLNKTKIPLLVVSHDREFLDNITTRTIFLRTDGAHAFKTHFSSARQELLQRDAARAQQRALEDKEIERLKKMANQYKAWGVLNSNFHSKMKNTERRIDKIQNERADTYVKKERVLGLNDSDIEARTALRVENFDVTIPDGSRVLYHVDRLAIKPGDRVAILGANGTGKTMLLNAIAAQYDPNLRFYDSSKPVRFSPSVNMVYFDQRMKELPLNTTVMDYIEGGDRSNRSRTIALLSKAGFGFKRAESKIRELSYGEQSRLIFLHMKILKPNFYVLDEPTNHLDIEGQEDLEQQLEEAEVSCLFVSHDRCFIRMAANRFFEVRKGKLVEVESPDAFFGEQEAA